MRDDDSSTPRDYEERLRFEIDAEVERLAYAQRAPFEDPTRYSYSETSPRPQERRLAFLERIGLLHLADDIHALAAALEERRHGPRPPRRLKRKSSTLLVLHVEPGPCVACRHVNQGTMDFSEGHLFCEVAQAPKSRGQSCDTTMRLPRDPGEPVDAWRSYFYFEPHRPGNGTYGELHDRRVLAEDATPALRAGLQADIPHIPAEYEDA